VVHVADQEVTARGEALRQLRVDELVDHDPRRHDATREAVPEDGREDDERGQPRPRRHARQPTLWNRRRWLGPAVPRKPDLIKAACELRRELGSRLDADIRGGLCDLRDDGVGDDRPAGGLLQRSGICLGDVGHVVLALDVRPRRVAHRELCRLARGEQLERTCELGDLVVVDRHLERHVVGQLGEPAEIADDEGAPERERANDAPGRFTHRGGTKRDACVAGSDQRPEAPFVDVVDALDALADEALRVEAR
jgi:hypothetical protein